jgi:UrcA family protein
MKSSQRRPLTLGSLFLVMSASAALSTASVAGDATPDRSRPAVHIRLADLNLATPQGTAAAYKRIASAAQSVCSAYDGAALAQHLVWRQCVSGSVDSAVAQVGDARLTAYNLSMTGRGTLPAVLASR